MFQNVSTGIAMLANNDNNGYLNVNYTLNADIHNCSFNNCFGQAISGVGNGYSNGDNHSHNGTIISQINNCSFNTVGSGCSFDIYGAYNSWTGGGSGFANLQIQNNIFTNVTGTVISLISGIYAGSGTTNSSIITTAGGGVATLINNVIVNAGNGVVSQDPWDARVGSCIFENCGNAVYDTGTLSRNAGYNDFYAKNTNFTGYPSIYGTVVLVNRNGTPCDFLYNIFQDPQFVSATNFQLQATSPCIEAGVPDAAYFDSYFPPSQGSVTNDIGAYGGPNAGLWIFPAPTNMFSLSIALYVGVTINPPTDGHYQLQYAPTLAGTNNWIQITNMDLSAPFLYVEPMQSPQRFYRAVLQ